MPLAPLAIKTPSLEPGDPEEARGETFEMDAMLAAMLPQSNAQASTRSNETKANATTVSGLSPVSAGKMETLTL